MQNPHENDDALARLAEVVAREAGDLLLHSRRDILRSEGKDIKLSADMEAHELIQSRLRDTGIPMLSEEDAVHSYDGSETWVVDPLDGSLNYVRGIPTSAVSIALVRNMRPVCGVVYDFNRGELFRGVVGLGAWLNEVPMHVSTIGEKRNAVIMSGFPSYTDYGTDALLSYVERIQQFKKVRLIGSAALSLAYVAAGRADVYYERGIKLWDVAAGLALLQASRGVYTLTSLDSQYGYEVCGASLPDFLIQ